MVAGTTLGVGKSVVIAGLCRGTGGRTWSSSAGPTANSTRSNTRCAANGSSEVVLDSLGALSQRFDAVVCEGVGSPAEVNLRSSDIVNMGLAVAARLPVVVVGDIDRGGVFAHFLGTLAALHASDQCHIAGFVVNDFRGEAALLTPALEWLRATTGRPCLGVLPWRLVQGTWAGERVDGYQIHQGRISVEAVEEFLDALADLVTEHLDTALLWRLLEQGPPPGLPALPSGLDALPSGLDAPAGGR
jgi:cobyric acid synthase